MESARIFSSSMMRINGGTVESLSSQETSGAKAGLTSASSRTTLPPPWPSPVRVYLLKFACTDVSLMIDTLHDNELPEQAPLQPTNDFPSGGVAVKVTVVPRVNLAEQAFPQLTTRSLPAGVAVTAPA